MESAALFRIAAAGFVVGAVSVTIFAASLPPPAPPAPAVAHRPQPIAEDPARAELRRCQTLGAAGASDRACLTAWAQARERFIGGERAGRTGDQ